MTKLAGLSHVSPMDGNFDSISIQLDLHETLNLHHQEGDQTDAGSFSLIRDDLGRVGVCSAVTRCRLFDRKPRGTMTPAALK